MKSKQPNIILLVSDNQRIDQVGCHRGTICQTPFLDWIGEEGVVMENLRTTSPVCSPARASMFTGFDPQEAGVPTVHPSWPGQVEAGTAQGRIRKPLITEYLRTSGYQCLYAGKWHVGEENLPGAWDRYQGTRTDFGDYSEWCRSRGLPDGFIFNDPVRGKKYRFHEPPHMSLPMTGVLDIPEDAEINRWMLDQALELYEQRDRAKPLFMVFSTYGIHPPLQVPEKYYNMYNPEKLDEPLNFGPNPADHEPATIGHSYFRREFDHWGPDFNSAWRKSVAVSHGYATYINDLFEQFIRRVEADGILENTLLTMVSDHGDMLGQHGLVAKFCPYEENLRVPWLMRWPGEIESGTRCPFDATMNDVAATILSAAGIDPRERNLAGTDVLPMVHGEAPIPESRDCFSQFTRPEDWKSWHATEDWRLIYRRPWKYVLYQNAEQELFNLDSDPGERANLAGFPETDGICQELNAALRSQADGTGDPFFTQMAGGD